MMAIRQKVALVLVTAALVALPTSVWAARKAKKARKPAPAATPAQPAAATAEKPAAESAEKPQVTLPLTDKSTPQQVADAVQAFYEKQPGFQAHFAQVVKKKGLANGISREGVVYLQRGDAKTNKPGKMRWEYTKDEVFYYCNGVTLWAYERRERLATKVPVKNSQVYQATSYLVGQGNLGRDFQMDILASPEADVVPLKLTPRKGTGVMRSLTLLVERKTGAVRGSRLIDPLGDETALVWQDVKYAATGDEVFEWTPPPGVQVKSLQP
jgi:outer membrane lipoprotein-sorting protein